MALDRSTYFGLELVQILLSYSFLVVLFNYTEDTTATSGDAGASSGNKYRARIILCAEGTIPTIRRRMQKLSPRIKMLCSRHVLEGKRYELQFQRSTARGHRIRP
jgi:hypothetical protein